jgi:hypothetical protein
MNPSQVTVMETLRPMPEREKYQHADEMVRLYQKHVLPFVESRLGYAEMHNLRSVWQAAITPIHEDDNDQDKYAQAYSNWIWMARCSHDALAEQLSAEEVIDYKRLLLRLYEQQMNNPNLTVLRFLKNYAGLAKEMLYEMQWLTPIELTSLSNEEITCVVQDCKILHTPGAIRVCRVDCRNVGTAYARRLYSLKRVTMPSDHGCTITLTPIER